MSDAGLSLSGDLGDVKSVLAQRMFDVFDIFLDHLSTGTRIEVRRRETAFGLGDEQVLYVDGADIARIDPTSGSGTIVLLGSTAANQASTDHTDWKRLLAGLVVLLDAHPGWRVTCESDCDQHPLHKAALSPRDLASLLDSHRSTGERPIALEVMAP